MIVIQEDGNYFGETRILGIGNAKPELKYGKVAKELREKANLSIEDLSKEFSIKAKLIEEMEAQLKGMTEEIMAKYCEKFNVKKEDFFDTNTARLILGDNGVVLKTFDTADECKETFDKIMNYYLENKDEFEITIDFRGEGLKFEDNCN